MLGTLIRQDSVNLYIETLKNGIRPTGHYCYVLEAVKPDGSTDERRLQAFCFHNGGTDVFLHARALTEALARIKPGSAVCAIMEPDIFRTAINDGWLRIWKANGWVKTNGGEVHNREAWDDVLCVAEQREIDLAVADREQYRQSRIIRVMRSELLRRAREGETADEFA